MIWTWMKNQVLQEWKSFGYARFAYHRLLWQSITNFPGQKWDSILPRNLTIWCASIPIIGNGAKRCGGIPVSGLQWPSGHLMHTRSPQTLKKMRSFFYFFKSPFLLLSKRFDCIVFGLLTTRMGDFILLLKCLNVFCNRKSEVRKLFEHAGSSWARDWTTYKCFWSDSL